MGPMRPIWGLTLLLLAACEDYATVEELHAVAGDVARVDRTRGAEAQQLGRAVSATADDVSAVAARQRETAQVVAAMGDGFNVLSEAVEEAHDASLQVARRQDRLEAQVARELAPPYRRAAPAPAQTAPPSYTGTPRIVGPNAPPAEPPPLRLVLDAPPWLEAADVDPGRAPLRYDVEEVGRRLYAVLVGDAAGAPGAPNLLCLDVIAGDAGGDAFTAARCELPAVLYEFQRD